MLPAPIGINADGSGVDEGAITNALANQAVPVSSGPPGGDEDGSTALETAGSPELASTRASPNGPAPADADGGSATESGGTPALAGTAATGPLNDGRDGGANGVAGVPSSPASSAPANTALDDGRDANATPGNRRQGSPAGPLGEGPRDQGSPAGPSGEGPLDQGRGS